MHLLHSADAFDAPYREVWIGNGEFSFVGIY